MKTPLVTSGQEWNEDLIEQVFQHIEDIAINKYKLDVYPNQIEIITYEQMLDAYSSLGLPVYYPHWSFGEQFVKELEMYKRGHMGLAYEIVINSNPCIAYLMEENTMLMQTLVMAHACFGHNFFFKNNYLFKQWTQPDAIIDYLNFAKRYIRDCEDKYGIVEVEQTIDACHALAMHGIFKYKHPRKLSVEEEKQLQEERARLNQLNYNEIWKTVPKLNGEKIEQIEENFPKSPEENILYFIEKNAPRLQEWQREIIRIVRKVSQYFYPQGQTKVSNEGTATYFHYKIMHDLYDRGVVDDGAMLEFYTTHTAVVNQRNHARMNPYALGFAIYQDIERVAMNPTDEDKQWFGKQDWVGSGDYLSAIKWAVQNFKDESFVRQFISPKVIRDFKFFTIRDDERDPQYEVTAIHNTQGYKEIRDVLSNQYNIGHDVPDIQVVNVDRWGDRSLTLHHNMVNNVPLDGDTTTKTIQYLSWLWGYPVILHSIDQNNNIRSTWTQSNDGPLLDFFLVDDN